MYVILQLQHSVGDVSNSTSSTVQSLTELVVFFFCFGFVSCGSIYRLKYNLVIPSEKQEVDMYAVLG